MTREQLDALARRYLSARFDEIEERLAVDRDPNAREAVSFDLNERAHELDAALAHGDYDPAIDRARKLIPDEDDLTQLKLARRLIEAELEACIAEIAALSGRPLTMPSLARHAPVAEEPKETPRFSDVVELFVQDKLAQNAWTPRSEAQNRAILSVVGELLKNPRIGNVTKDDIRKFALTLPLLPSNAGKKFRRMSIHQVLEAVGDREDIPRLKPKTINNGFAALRAVFRWAKRDVEMNAPWYNGERAYCPLCGGSAADIMTAAKTGFAFPKGLWMHLRGEGNAKQCRIMIVAGRLARAHLGVRDWWR